MIEKTILTYLMNTVQHPIYMEKPKSPEPDKYYLMEKTGSGQQDMLFNSTIAIQSIAPTMYEAAELNEDAKAAMHNAIILNGITRVRLNSDYNYTDTQTKQYRYQAVFDIVHY